MDKDIIKKWMFYIILSLEAVLVIGLMVRSALTEQITIFCGGDSGKNVPVYGYELELPRGSYDIEITYSADVDGGSVQPFAEVSYGKVYGEKVKTYRAQTTKKFEHYLYEKTDSFGIIVSGGDGNLNVDSLTITRNAKLDNAFCFTLFVFLLLIDIIVYLVWKKRIWEKISQEQRNVCIGLLFVFVFSLIPLYTNYYMTSHDTSTHMRRIEGLAEGIRMGQFPVRMQPVWLNDYGYPISVLYGDLLLYIPAVLRLIGYSLMNCYKIYIAFVSLITVIISYICFKNITKSPYVGLLCSALYTLSAYRIINVYIRSAAGEFTAMAFFPLVFYALGKMFYAEGVKAREEKLKSAVYLIIAYTVILQTHTLSFEMIIVFTALFCLSFGYKFFKNIFVLLKTAVVTIVLNLSFLVPFIDYMSSHEMNWDKDEPPMIQHDGIFPAQLMQTFHFGGSLTRDVSAGTSSEMPLTIGIALGLVLFIFIWQLFAYGKRMWPHGEEGEYRIRQCRIATFMIIAIYMSCWFFPWKWFADFPKIGKYLVPYQYPWRFLIFATVFGVFLAGMVINNMERLNQRMLRNIAITLLASCTVVSAVSLYDRMLTNYSAETINSAAYFDPLWMQGGEYMLKYSSASTSVNTGFSVTDGVNVISEEREHYHIRAEVDNSTSESQDLIAPMFAYKGFVAREGSTGNELLTYADASTMRLAVVLPAGYKGMIEINFEAPFYWRIAELVSVLTFIALIVYILYRKKNGYFDNTNKTNSDANLFVKTGKSGRKKLI